MKLVVNYFSVCHVLILKTHFLHLTRKDWLILQNCIRLNSYPFMLWNLNRHFLHTFKMSRMMKDLRNLLEKWFKWEKIWFILWFIYLSDWLYFYQSQQLEWKKHFLLCILSRLGFLIGLGMNSYLLVEYFERDIFLSLKTKDVLQKFQNMKSCRGAL